MDDRIALGGIAEMIAGVDFERVGGDQLLGFKQESRRIAICSDGS